MENRITDKGWAAMSKLLDRELPEKRRRRFGWWWFGLLLLPVALYGSWRWLRDTHAPPQKQEQATQLPSASVATISSQSTPSAPTTTGTEPRASIYDNHSTLHNTAVKNPQTRSKGTSFNQAVTQTNMGSAQHSPLLSEIDKEPTHPSPEPLTIIETPGPTDLSGDFSTLPPLSLELLPTFPKALELPTGKIVATPATLVALDSKPAQKTSRSHWALGATSTISTEQFNAINGFSTGVNVDWTFAPKWGLRTGLMYSIYTPEEKYRPVASIMPENYTSNIDGDVLVLDLITGTEVLNLAGNSTYGDSLTDNVFIPVNRLQRLEIPATVFWQPIRVLKVVGGFSLKRTLSVQADRQNYSGDYILKLSDQSAEDGASKLSSTELDNWSADASLGVGLRLSDVFELGFSAKMPLNKFQTLVKADEGAYSAGLKSQPVGAAKKQSSPVFSMYGTLFF